MLIRKALVASALVLAATSWSGPTAAESQNWTWCVNRGGKFSLDLQIKGCTAIMQSRGESPRNLAIAHNNRGLAYSKKEDYDKAIADFGEAVRIDQNYADAYMSRANAYSDKGDHDRAVADYNKSLRLNPKDPVAFNNRCDELLIIHQAQAALADCNESLRLRPNHANTTMHRGNVYLALGQFEKAIADYDTALRLNAKDEWSLYGRGLAKVKLGDATGNADMTAAKAITGNIATGFDERGIK